MPPAQTGAGSDPIAGLRSLHSSGLLTDAEFAEALYKLLDHDSRPVEESVDADADTAETPVVAPVAAGELAETAAGGDAPPAGADSESLSAALFNPTAEPVQPEPVSPDAPGARPVFRPAALAAEYFGPDLDSSGRDSRSARRRRERSRRRVVVGAAVLAVLLIAVGVGIAIATSPSHHRPAASTSTLSTSTVVDSSTSGPSPTLSVTSWAPDPSSGPSSPSAVLTAATAGAAQSVSVGGSTAQITVSQPTPVASPTDGSAAAGTARFLVHVTIQSKSSFTIAPGLFTARTADGHTATGITPGESDGLENTTVTGGAPLAATVGFDVPQGSSLAAVVFTSSLGEQLAVWSMS